MSLRQFRDLIRKKMLHFKLNDASTFTNYTEKLEKLNVLLRKQFSGLVLDSVNRSAQESVANSTSHFTMQQPNAELNELLQNGEIFINASKAIVDFWTANENYKMEREQLSINLTDSERNELAAKKCGLAMPEIEIKKL